MSRFPSLEQDTLGKLYMFCAMLVSGTIGWFVLRADLPVFNLVFFRCLLGFSGLVAYCYWRGFFPVHTLTKKQWSLIFLGGITLCANWCFLFTAYRLTSIGITTVVYNTQPFLLVLAGWLIWKEKPTKPAILWLVLAFTGLILMSMPKASANTSHYFLGIAFALMAALLYAASTLFTRALSQAIRPELIATSHMFIGLCAFLPLFNFNALPSSATQISAVLTLGLVHSAFMYILLYSAYQKAATSSIAILGFVYPLTAVVIDFLAYGQLLTLSQILGGILIAGSAACYSANLNPFHWLFAEKT